jgi:hypothetical protein
MKIETKFKVAYHAIHAMLWASVIGTCILQYYGKRIHPKEWYTWLLNVPLLLVEVEPPSQLGSGTLFWFTDLLITLHVLNQLGKIRKQFSKA